MDDLIKRQDAIRAVTTRDGCGRCEKAIKNIPSVDAVEVVRCKDCKHRQVNEHYGEEDYLNLKVMCNMDTGDPFELGRNAWDDNWFCADGERKTDG